MPAMAIYEIAVHLTSYAGLNTRRAITLDATAAGYGWFVDFSPQDDAEFTTPGDQGEQGRMDRLTVVLHEMGHVLGLEDDDPAAFPSDLMATALGTGIRRLQQDRRYCKPG